MTSRRYNSLNDIKINDLEIGLCPVCCRRLTAECEHQKTIEREEWYAAHIVAEQLFQSPQREPAQAAEPEGTKCICVDFINFNPDPVPNPDCPLHGAMKELPKAVTWQKAMQQREQDFNKRYYNNPDGLPEWGYTR
jgi:hypothetical protein